MALLDRVLNNSPSQESWVEELQLEDLSRLREIRFLEASIRRCEDPVWSEVSFEGQTINDSTGNIPSTGTHNIRLTFTWETKALQGVLNLLGGTVDLEDQVTLAREFTLWGERISSRLLELEQENQELRRRLEQIALNIVIQ